MTEGQLLLEACKAARDAADADAQIKPGSPYYNLIVRAIREAEAAKQGAR